MEQRASQPPSLREPRKEGWISLALLLAGQLIGASSFAAVDPCPPSHSSPGLGESIGLDYGNELSFDVVEGAMGLWQSCSGYGRDFPHFIHGAGGSRTIRIKLVIGSSRSRICGVFQGSTITLYAWAIDSKSKPLSCGSQVQNLAHELGHVLRLSDVSDRFHCSTQIMSHITPSNRHRRSVTQRECAAARWSWLTPFELARAERLGYYRREGNGGRGRPLAQVDALLKTSSPRYTGGLLH